MPDGELGRYCEALRDEKRALVDRLLRVREEIKKLAEELSKIEDKFKVPVIKVIYRSTLAVPYTITSNGKQYVEYRVWVHSSEKGKYPIEIMEDWYLKLLDLFPPRQPALRARLEDPSAITVGYEEDEEIDQDEIAPEGARMDKVYGAATYTPWLYLAEQVNGELGKLGETVISPEAVDKLLRRFGVKLPEHILHARGRRHYTREQKRGEKKRERTWQRTLTGR